MEILGNMNKKIKIFAGVFTVILLTASVFISCSDDIILEPLPTLLGEYEGRYIVTENVGTTSARTHEFDITWRFTDQNYFLRNPLPDEQGLCSPSGTYTLTGEVELSEPDNNDGCAGVIGQESFNPRGIFSLRQPEDSIILTQQSDDMRKEIKLLRVQ